MTSAILLDIVSKPDILISCKTPKEWNLVVKTATEQFERFIFLKHSNWSRYKEETVISITNKSYGTLEIYETNNPTFYKIVEARDVLKTREENPEYFL